MSLKKAYTNDREDGDEERSSRKRVQISTKTPLFAESKICEEPSNDMDVDVETEVYNDFQPPSDMLHRIDTSQSVKCFLKRRFSTTSSVYADNTIMSPDLGQIIFW
jgi:hypothetical protein